MDAKKLVPLVVIVGGIVFKIIERMPDDAPPKWMFNNITALREEHERILEQNRQILDGLRRLGEEHGLQLAPGRRWLIFDRGEGFWPGWIIAIWGLIMIAWAWNLYVAGRPASEEEIEHEMEGIRRSSDEDAERERPS